MATTRTSAPRTPAATKSNTSSRSAPKSTVEKASDAVTKSADSFIDTVKKSPIASAVIAAGVAGAGALIWANRSQIAEQAGALGEKASDLGGKIGERASAVGEKLSEQASALGEKVSEKYAAATGTAAKSQQEYAEEALSLKQSVDPMIDEQSKIGSVSY
ncbi:hypothetical protein [Sphingomonas sp. RB1R13]|uniref:hypothetical protein n=1 Tax=Sphingomonas sp. RB1R13 TaxID=3096159 RepID=UPI002FCC4607